MFSWGYFVFHKVMLKINLSHEQPLLKLLNWIPYRHVSLTKTVQMRFTMEWTWNSTTSDWGEAHLNFLVNLFCWFQPFLMCVHTWRFNIKWLILSFIINICRNDKFVPKFSSLGIINEASHKNMEWTAPTTTKMT